MVAMKDRSLDLWFVAERIVKYDSPKINKTKNAVFAISFVPLIPLLLIFRLNLLLHSCLFSNQNDRSCIFCKSNLCRTCTYLGFLA